MDDIEKVVEVSTAWWTGCPICRNYPDDAGSQSTEEIAPRVNHLLGHGLVLLHVGQQTGRDGDGAPWHSTVAVLGQPSLNRDERAQESV